MLVEVYNQISTLKSLIETDNIILVTMADVDEGDGWRTTDGIYTIKIVTDGGYLLQLGYKDKTLADNVYLQLLQFKNPSGGEIPSVGKAGDEPVGELEESGGDK